MVEFAELLSELAKREKQAGIYPEADVDLFMKVIFWREKILVTVSCCNETKKYHSDNTFSFDWKAFLSLKMQATALSGVESSLATDYTLKVSWIFL